MIELLITIAVLAILVAIGLPSMRDFVVANRLTSDINSFVGLVNFARSEAITRNQSVVICPKTSSTSNTCSTSSLWALYDIEVFVDVNGDNTWNSGDILLKTLPAIDPTGQQTAFTRPSGTTNKVIFGSSGFSQTALRFNVHTIKSGDAAYEFKYGRAICISKPGRARIIPYSTNTCTSF